MDGRRAFGDEGEALASAFVSGLGYRLLASQYRTRGGEIDLIAQEGEEIVFIEVKTRRGREFGYPEESVTPQKIQKILRTIFFYLREKKKESARWRLDVIAIEEREQGPEIAHFKAIDIPESLW